MRLASHQNTPGWGASEGGGPTRPHRRFVNRSAPRIELIDYVMGGPVESIESTVDPLSGTTCPLGGMVYHPANDADLAKVYILQRIVL